MPAVQLKLLDLAAAKEKPHIKGIPKTLPELADAYYITMQERLAMDKEAARLKEREVLFKELLIANLPLSQATGVAGKVARVTIKAKVRAKIVDWEKTYEYIKKNWAKGAYGLLQRRLNEAAVAEMWEKGQQLPGVEPEQYKSISYSKL
jgi:hypothetical protein